jgi:hypothetical protein
LGNQIFQISNAIRIQEIYNLEIEIDTSWFTYDLMKSKLVSSRKYELDYFKTPKKAAKLELRIIK